VTVLSSIMERLADRPPYVGPDRSAELRRPFPAAGGGEGDLRIIGEFKRRSPSRGALAMNLEPAVCARAYERGGAVGLSVLTEPNFFQGDPEDLWAAREATGLPVLRKDFLRDVADVGESRRMGADAVLLIVAVLGEATGTLLDAAEKAGLEALVEVHDEAEAHLALSAGAKLIGVNNRDLKTFETDPATTRRLLPLLRGRARVVSESGFFTRADCLPLAREGVDAFLVGEALLTGRSDLLGPGARP